MVTILIVTYGDRWGYLASVINHLLNLSNSIQIVIVDNGTTYDVSRSINIFDRASSIKIIRLKENMGSAFGFKVGLEYVLENEATEFIWLLDDDNVPLKDCLIELLSYWQSIQNSHKNELQSLLPLRINRKYLVNVANGEPIEFNFPSNNAFLGFNLIRFPLYLKHKFYNQTFKKKNDLKHSVQIPFAPYGGLFMHKNLAKLIGFPDVRFYIYSDDFEYTNRITQMGGSILLIPKCKIMDIESVWYEAPKSRFLGSRYLAQNNFRSYFVIRNSVYFSIKVLCSSKFFFVLNMLIYTASMFLLALISFRLNHYLIFIRAVKDGINGNFKNNELIRNTYNK